MSQLSYTEIVQKIETRGVMPAGPPSLAPMIEGLNLLQSELELGADQVIVVAGTNGKGSVSASLEALLLAAGESVGLYTSPHLEETTERFRIQGQDISKEDFCEAFEQVSQKLMSLKLTHFEILTLMAVWIFFSKTSHNRVNRAIFEVGLGGVWDATNAIPHSCCVITSLGFDHQNLLGNSLREIASNKFGIVTPNSLVVHAPLPQEVQTLADEVKQITSSHWIECVPFELKEDRSLAEPRFQVQTPWGVFPITLPGQRGAQNSAIALTLFHALGYSPQQYGDALQTVRWPGRMEKVRCEQSPCPLYLSGDHNPQGIESLLQLLPSYQRHHLHLLVGVGVDKDSDSIFQALFQIRDCSIYLTETPFKGRPIEDYGTWKAQARGAWKDPMQALDSIFKAAQPDDLILVTGSLYLVGLVRAQIRKI